MVVATWFPPFLDGLIFVIGVPGNYLVIKVFSKRHPHLHVHALIIGLALADLMVCVCRMVIMYIFIVVDPHVQNDAAIMRCRISDASLHFSIYMSLFLLTLIATDRYTACRVPRGFRRRSVNQWKTKFVIVLSTTSALILACAFTLPAEYKLLEEDGDQHHCIIVSPRWLTNVRLFSLLAATAVAFLVTFWLYLALFRAVRRRNRVSVDGHSRPSLSLISAATQVSLMLPHNFPASDLRAHPSLAATAPPGIEMNEVATTSFQRTENSLPSSVSSNDASRLNLTSKAPGRQQENRHNNKPRVKFDDLQTRVRCRDEYRLSELLKYPRRPRPTTNQFNSGIIRMAFAKSLLFFATWLPVLLLQTKHDFFRAGLSQDEDTWPSVALNLVLINSAVTVLIFLLVSRRFREVFKESFHSIRCFWEPRFERAFHPSYLNRYSK